MARHRKTVAGAVSAYGGGGANAGSGVPVRRCAIYTRKSTEEGLDQGFNSLDAQREACEAYVLSQRHEGWRLLTQAYDDGGYSGGSMARPGLQALMASVDAGEIDVVVVYKVDRLTRSLADFAKIVERFDRRGVSFVSVTQAFNTTSSMGRLTLNVLLSFAQFEREVGAERVRDKVAASRRKGMWMGGTVPLGYRAENRKLVIDDEEAERVRLIFQLYLQLRSTSTLLVELRGRGITTARRKTSGCRHAGGVPFGPGPISYLLHNRIYIGEVEHKGEFYKGEHEAILDRVLFEAVQEQLKSNANDKRQRARSQAILTGRIFDSVGNRMSPTHANKDGVRYRYYVTRAIAEGRPKEAGEVRRVAAADIERIVLDTIAPRFGHEAINGEDAAALDLIERHLERVEVLSDQLMITLVGAPEQSGTASGATSADLTIAVHWSRPAGRPKRELMLAVEPAAKQADALQAQLIASIINARSWMQELTSGAAVSVDALAKREGKHPRSIRTALSFAFLAPDIVERIMAGDVPCHLTLTDIGRGLPVLWSEQRRMMAA